MHTMTCLHVHSGPRSTALICVTCAQITMKFDVDDDERPPNEYSVLLAHLMDWEDDGMQCKNNVNGLNDERRLT